MTRKVNLVRSKARQGMLTRLAESPGRPLERYGNVAPREMAVRGSNPRTEPGVSADPFPFILMLSCRCLPMFCVGDREFRLRFRFRLAAPVTVSVLALTRRSAPGDVRLILARLGWLTGTGQSSVPTHIRRSAPGDARPMLGNTERNWLGIRQTLSLAYFRGRYVSAGSSGGDGGVVGRQCWWGSIHRGGRTCGVPSRMRMFQPLVSR